MSGWDPSAQFQWSDLPDGIRAMYLQSPIVNHVVTDASIRCLTMVDALAEIIYRQHRLNEELKHQIETGPQPVVIVKEGSVSANLAVEKLGGRRAGKTEQVRKWEQERMTRQVYKYEIPLHLTDEPFEVEMVADHRRLHYGSQRGAVMLWAEIEQGSTKQFRFQWYGTGHPVRGKWQHMIQSGPFVWHLYALTDDDKPGAL